MKTKLKTLLTVSIMALIVVISTISNAASVGMTLSSNSKLKAGDTVTVTMSLGNIDAGNGIDTITAELNYDKNVFETVETSNLIASNSWTPTYASSTNMLTAVKNSKVTKGETVLTITLKVKSTLSVKSTTVTLKDIVVSGGRVQDGGTGDINVNNASVTINADSDAISKNENTISNTTTTTNTTTNTTKQNTTLKDNTVTKKTTLPKTGIEQGGVIAIVVIAIVGTFSYVLYKKTSKEVK
ncbi:MAG: cohesin domain-containing protein [Clostridia bacterium]|nr:LPXTG cell wall anchor domain-containing protein [bacterium]